MVFSFVTLTLYFQAQKMFSRTIVCSRFAPTEIIPSLIIEPWQGHTDYEDFTGELEDKEGIHKLAVGETYQTEMSFIVNN